MAEGVARARGAESFRAELCAVTERIFTVAVPKRKMSRSNTRSRRSQWKAAPLTLVTCDRCKARKLPHTACPECGTYAKRQVLDV